MLTGRFPWSKSVSVQSKEFNSYLYATKNVQIQVPTSTINAKSNQYKSTEDVIETTKIFESEPWLKLSNSSKYLLTKSMEFCPENRLTVDEMLSFAQREWVL